VSANKNLIKFVFPSYLVGVLSFKAQSVQGQYDKMLLLSVIKQSGSKNKIKNLYYMSLN
jgi:hypothetical protein